MSGGTDSLALAHILADLCHNLQLEIHIATFNHGLRPEATAETQFVGQVAQTLNIPYTIGQGDVLAMQSAQKLSLEEAARKMRYEFLADVARQIGATTIVTAHHQDDQAETVLFQLIRGTGSTLGMRWISPCPYAPQLRLVRPLLTTSRNQLELYCAENGLNPVFDPSNDDITLTRNAIRHQIMPLLEHINPQVSSALARFADIHTESQDALQDIFINTILPFIKQNEDTFHIPREKFRTWHVAYQRKLFTHLLDNIPNITYEHINHAVHIGMMGANGTIAQFPQGWQLRVMYDDLVLGYSSTAQSLPQDKLFLPENGEILIKIG
ncbi:MAG: tRNA lysidine(34) synthetase TilS, partial [Anaerolineae bacterium]|nr:tRNA lysidine(34) synthetase TilS [Anaerolineae bacterium]